MMNHLLIGRQCVFCRQPKAVANYLSFDSWSVDFREFHSHELLAESHGPCPASWFFLGKAVLLGLTGPCSLLLGWETTMIYLLLLYLISTYVPVHDPRRWFGLDEVKNEYENLAETLKAVRRLYYLQHIDGVIRPLIEAREKAFHIIPVLAEEPLSGMELRLRRLEEKAESTENAELKMTFQAQARDLRENLDKLKKMAWFMEKFEANKRSIASSLKLLRTKILLAETTGDDAEVKRILDDLQSLHAIYDRVNEDLQV